MIPGIFAGFPVSGGGGLTPYRDAVLADNPVGYWPLYETTGSVAENLGSTGLDGTYGSVTLAQPSLCGDAGDFAGSFNGSTSIITVTGNTAFLYANSFTYEAIIKPSGSGYRAIINRNAGHGYLRLNPSGKLEWLASQTAFLGENNTALSNGTAYHVMVVVGAGTAATFYLNGVADGTAAGYADFDDPTADSLLIGSENSEPWSGIIDEPAIYNTALSGARAAAHAAAAGY